VNGVVITAERLERYQEEAVGGRDAASISNPGRFKRLKREALDQLIEQELLWQEARRADAVAPQAEVDAALAQLRTRFPSEAEFTRRLERAGFTARTYEEYLRRLLSISRLVERDVAQRLEVTDDEVHAAYAADPMRFARPEEVHLRLILVKADATADGRADARARAERLLAEASAGGDFAALARSHSGDPSAPAGGDLGFVARGRLAPPLEEAAFTLAVGAVSPPIESPEGLHLLKCEDRRGGDPAPEAEAGPGIRRKLLAEKLQRAVAERVKALREGARIEIGMGL
jgi:parvulin-like peptidyl-prolyl isomerase